MATDYLALAQRNRVKYGEEESHLRIYKRLYSDNTHFIDELIQNADDKHSSHLNIKFDGSRELAVWNWGYLFTPRDVEAICSVGLSDKDLTDIGTFGIGFKAVYAYTDAPEIYSGGECFRITRFVEPSPVANVPQSIAHLHASRKTVFRLPLTRKLQPDDLTKLRRLDQHIDVRALLFLKHLSKIVWRGPEGSVVLARSRRRHPLIDAWDTRLRVQQDELTERTERFLVFEKSVVPTPAVINDALRRAEDQQEADRIRRSAEAASEFTVAFQSHGGVLMPISRAVVSAFLPTRQETHLKFLIQARYQTTPDRSAIAETGRWNRWLLQETARFLPEVLERLKASGVLAPASFAVFPLLGGGETPSPSGDEVPPPFDIVAESMRSCLRKRRLIPRDDGGFAPAHQVFYPEAEEVRTLLDRVELADLTGVSRASWLHADVRDTKAQQRHFDIFREAGVEAISVERLVGWLSGKSIEWWSQRADIWIRTLYQLMSREGAQWARLRQLPIVRLEGGEHVRPAESTSFFPPTSRGDVEVLEPFLPMLPVVRRSLLSGAPSARQSVTSFLQELDVTSLKSTGLHPPLAAAEVRR